MKQVARLPPQWITKSAMTYSWYKNQDDSSFDGVQQTNKINFVLLRSARSLMERRLTSNQEIVGSIPTGRDSFLYFRAILSFVVLS